MTPDILDFFHPDKPVGGGLRAGPGGGDGELAAAVRSIVGVAPSGMAAAVYGDLSLDAYDGPEATAHGGFLRPAESGRDGILIALIDPMGRGPRAALLGAYLRGVLDAFIAALGPTGGSPASAALLRLDAALDDALGGLGLPGAMAAMSALIVNARAGRVTLLCRGTGGVAAVRASGAPAWMDAGAAPPLGFMPSGMLPPSARPEARTYAFGPGDALVLGNGQFDEVPGLGDLVARELVPTLAARAIRGGPLAAGGAALNLPRPGADAPSVPARMAAALYALRLAGLRSDESLPRTDLAVPAAAAGYLEALCRESGLALPEPDRGVDGQVRYAACAPERVKPPLVALARRA